MTSDLSHPPSHPVEWAFRCEATRSTTYVVARTFYYARAKAMALLGCGPDEIQHIDGRAYREMRGMR